MVLALISKSTAKLVNMPTDRTIVKNVLKTALHAKLPSENAILALTLSISTTKTMEFALAITLSL
jgi:hypothetical protein